jgi:hypothetical protein
LEKSPQIFFFKGNFTQNTVTPWFQLYDPEYTHSQSKFITSFLEQRSHESSGIIKLALNMLQNPLSKTDFRATYRGFQAWRCGLVP